jgi:PHD/YefM family antitoxin component YafN of YafNO toxin-antitoxin module
MSVTVSVSQLPEIINRAISDDDVCLIERNGKNIAVVVSLREWQRRTVGQRLDALGSAHRLAADKQRRTQELLAQRHLTKAQEKELDTLLQEADEIMLRRAEALDSL